MEACRFERYGICRSEVFLCTFEWNVNNQGSLSFRFCGWSIWRISLKNERNTRMFVWIYLENLLNRFSGQICQFLLKTCGRGVVIWKYPNFYNKNIPTLKYSSVQHATSTRLQRSIERRSPVQSPIHCEKRESLTFVNSPRSTVDYSLGIICTIALQ